MSFELDTISRYAEAHDRLMGSEPYRPKALPQPPKKPREYVEPVMQPKPPEPVFEALLAPGDITKAIILEVCKKHKLTVGELLSHRRMARIVRARQEAFWRLSKETSLSLPQMAKRLGGFDHTTALHSIAKHQSRIDSGEIQQETKVDREP